MSKIEPDEQADIGAAIDRGEPVSLMEPLLIGDGARQRAALTDPKPIRGTLPPVT